MVVVDVEVAIGMNSVENSALEIIDPGPVVLQEEVKEANVVLVEEEAEVIETLAETLTTWVAKSRNLSIKIEMMTTKKTDNKNHVAIVFVMEEILRWTNIPEKTTSKIRVLELTNRTKSQSSSLIIKMISLLLSIEMCA